MQQVLLARVAASGSVMRLLLRYAPPSTIARRAAALLGTTPLRSMAVHDARKGCVGVELCAANLGDHCGQRRLAQRPKFGTAEERSRR